MELFNRSKKKKKKSESLPDRLKRVEKKPDETWGEFSNRLVLERKKWEKEQMKGQIDYLKKCACGKPAKFVEQVYILVVYRRWFGLGPAKRESVEKISIPLCEECFNRTREHVFGKEVENLIQKNKKYCFVPSCKVTEELRKQLGGKGVYCGLRLVLPVPMPKITLGKEIPCAFCGNPTKRGKLFVQAFKNAITSKELPLCEKCERGDFSREIIFVEKSIKEGELDWLKPGIWPLQEPIIVTVTNTK